MTFIELFLLAFALSFDTFAVATAGGIVIGKSNIREQSKIALSFALFQAGFILLGLFLGSFLLSYIEKIDHWIAFILLLYIGGKMIYEALFDNDCDCVDLRSFKDLIICSVATSIDALAVGISLSVVSLTMIQYVTEISLVFIITFLAAILGLAFGKVIGVKIGNKSNILGGVILIIIGIKILLEHTILN